jgi:hypothetical protein
MGWRAQNSGPLLLQLKIRAAYANCFEVHFDPGRSMLRPYRFACFAFLRFHSGQAFALNFFFGCGSANARVPRCKDSQDKFP